MKFPNWQECLKLLKKYKVPKSVIQHSIEVKKNALKIAKRLSKRGIRINLELIKSAALLHDLGRWKYSKETGCHEESKRLHVYETYRLLDNLSYRKFAKICAPHALGGLNKKECRKLFSKEIDLIPRLIEAKIINIADKIRKNRNTLKKILNYYINNKKFKVRYFQNCPGLKEKSEKRISKIWKNLWLS